MKRKNKQPLSKYLLVLGLSIFLGFMICVLIAKTIIMLQTNIYLTLGTIIIIIIVILKLSDPEIISWKKFKINKLFNGFKINEREFLELRKR